MDLNIVEKSGSWFAYDGNRIGQGRDAVRMFLKDNPKLTDAIDAKVRAEMARINAAKVARSQRQEPGQRGQVRGLPHAVPVGRAQGGGERGGQARGSGESRGSCPGPGRAREAGRSRGPRCGGKACPERGRFIGRGEVAKPAQPVMDSSKK